MERCRRCNRPIPPRPPGTSGKAPSYCTDYCRRQYSEERDPDDRHDDEAILAVRRRLQNATYATERCRCEWPLAASDQDGTWVCIKCARPLLVGEAGVRQQVPPAA